MDAARNSPREGGFGQGKPYQKTKIGAKMEGAKFFSTVKKRRLLLCFKQNDSRLVLTPFAMHHS
jgi:hypothetical protein